MAEDSGYVLEASYVVWIEIAIFLLGFWGFLSVTTSHLPTLPSALIVMYGGVLFFMCVVMIMINAGLHGTETLKILRFEVRPNALVLGVLQGVMHVATASMAVLTIMSTYYMNADNEKLMLAALFSNRIQTYQLKFSTYLNILIYAGVSITVFALVVILFVTLRNSLGNLRDVRIHIFGFTDTVVIIFIWIQYYRGYMIDQLCPDNTICMPDDITLYENRDLFLLQLIGLVCVSKLALDVIMAKIYNMFKKNKEFVFFIVYFFLRLINIAEYGIAYFLFLEHEASNLKYVNWSVAAILVIVFVIEILFVLFSNNQAEKSEGPKFDAPKKSYFEWPNTIQLGARQKSLRRISPYVVRSIKQE